MAHAALLDTSALINTVDDGIVASLDVEQLLIASLSYAELRLGLVTARDVVVLRQRTRRIELISRTFGAGLPFDDECALAYERVVETAVGLGQGPRTNTVDRMIAAVALAHGMPLITSNAQDVRGLEDLVQIIDLSGSLPE